MAESRFIKTVIYGGYDKADVIRQLDYLNEQIHGLKNELRETKLLLENTKDAKDIQKSIDNVLAEERAKLTEVQVQNDNLSTQLKTAEEQNKKYENEIKKLTASLEETKSKLDEANTQLIAAKSNDDSLALSAVFIEAKKSADMIESAAKENSEKLEKSAAEAAEKSIAYANDESAIIIHEAECKAAEIIADAKNAAGKMETAYDNMRASVLTKMLALGEQLNDFRDALMKFEENGVGNLYECEELINKTEQTLKEGGVPVFKEPSKYAPDYPERPKRKADPDVEDAQKRKSGLDKLRQMAESISGNKGKDAPPTPEVPAAEETKTSENNNNNTKHNNNKKGSKIDLAAIAKQAKSLNDK